jgi:hypothetical protein
LKEEHTDDDIDELLISEECILSDLTLNLILLKKALPNCDDWLDQPELHNLERDTPLRKVRCLEHLLANLNLKEESTDESHLLNPNEEFTDVLLPDTRSELTDENLPVLNDDPLPDTRSELIDDTPESKLFN